MARQRNISAIDGDRPLFPDTSSKRTRLNDVDRLLEGYLDIEDDVETCDGEVTCAALIHRDDCGVAVDPLRTRGSLRAHRIA